MAIVFPVESNATERPKLSPAAAPIKLFPFCTQFEPDLVYTRTRPCKLAVEPLFAATVANVFPSAA